MLKELILFLTAIFLTSTVFAATSGTLYMDGNGNYGIGTAAPVQKLEVVGTVKATTFSGDGSGLTGVGATQWTTSASNIYYNTGSVGIGTIGPVVPLHIVGGYDANNPNSLILEGRTGTNTIKYTGLQFGRYTVPGASFFGIGADSRSNQIGRAHV